MCRAKKQEQVQSKDIFMDKVKYKILLVDDDPKIVELLKVNLESADYEVDTAYDGEEAISKIFKHNKNMPDLVILDLILPKISGYEVARQIKLKRETSKIPIIMLTGKNKPSDKMEGLISGKADYYLTKPIDINDLMIYILKTLSGKEDFEKKNKIRIMVIDDSEEFLGELQNILVSNNYDAIVLNNKLTAVEVARKLIPDLIILAFKSDDGSGIMIANELKKYGETGNIPIIAATNFFTKEQYKTATDNINVKACISKPIKTGEMLDCIESQINSGRKIDGEGFRSVLLELRKAASELAGEEKTDVIEKLKNKIDKVEKNIAQNTDLIDKKPAVPDKTVNAGISGKTQQNPGGTPAEESEPVKYAGVLKPEKDEPVPTKSPEDDIAAAPAESQAKGTGFKPAQRISADKKETIKTKAIKNIHAGDSIIRYACFYPVNQPDIEDVFNDNLLNIPKNFSKTPIICEKVHTQAVNLSDIDWQKLLSDSKERNAEVIFLLHPDDYEISELKDDIAEAGFVFYSVPISQLARRMIYIEIILDLMMIKK